MCDGCKGCDGLTEYQKMVRVLSEKLTDEEFTVLSEKLTDEEFTRLCQLVVHGRIHAVLWRA